MSGVDQAMTLAAAAPAGSTDWQDAPRLFKERFVFEDGADRWFYTVYSAGDPESRDELRYGLTDEASKLDVNQATETNLLKLPRMTRPLVDALLDFLDPDETARPDGAEQEYYSALPKPYKVRNGPLVSLDELLLVRGFTMPLLYGEDANMNFILDANENDAAQSFPPDDGDSKLDLGFRQYLTVDSYEMDETNEGVPRTNLNDPDDPLPSVESTGRPDQLYHRPAVQQNLHLLTRRICWKLEPPSKMRADTRRKLNLAWVRMNCLACSTCLQPRVKIDCMA